MQIISQEKKHSIGGSLLRVVGTVSEFTVMGKTPCLGETRSTNHLTNLELHSSLQRLWQHPKSPQHKNLFDVALFIDHFASANSWDEDGSYVVRLVLHP